MFSLRLYVFQFSSSFFPKLQILSQLFSFQESRWGLFTKCSARKFKLFLHMNDCKIERLRDIGDIPYGNYEIGCALLKIDFCCIRLLHLVKIGVFFVHYIPYAPHYKPRLVYFLHPFHCGLQSRAVHIRDNLWINKKILQKNPWFIIRCGFKSRAGYNGACTVYKIHGVDESITDFEISILEGRKSSQ